MTKEKERLFQDLSVGHCLMDSQHRKIVGLRDAVAAWADGGREDSGEFHRLLNEVVEALRGHFEAEEALMEQLSDPNLEAHKAEHLAETEAVLAVVVSAVEGFLDPKLLAATLSRLIEEHIRGSDAQYGALLAGRQEAARVAAKAERFKK